MPSHSSHTNIVQQRAKQECSRWAYIRFLLWFCADQTNLLLLFHTYTVFFCWNVLRARSNITHREQHNTTMELRIRLRGMLNARKHNATAINVAVAATTTKANYARIEHEVTTTNVRTSH